MLSFKVKVYWQGLKRLHNTLLLLAMGADQGWAFSTPYCFCRVYFCPEISRKAIFSAWMTIFPGGNVNSCIYLLASDCKSREKYICIHPIFSCIGSHSSQVFKCTTAYRNRPYIHKGGKSLLFCSPTVLGVALTIPIIKTSLTAHSSIFFLWYNNK